MELVSGFKHLEWHAKACGHLPRQLLAGTPNRVSTFHGSSWSSESYALCRSMTQMYKGIFIFRPSSRNRRTTNSMLTVGRARRIPPLFYEDYCSDLYSGGTRLCPRTLCLHEQLANSHWSCCSQIDPSFSDGPSLMSHIFTVWNMQTLTRMWRKHWIELG